MTLINSGFRSLMTPFSRKNPKIVLFRIENSRHIRDLHENGIDLENKTDAYINNRFVDRLLHYKKDIHSNV